MSNAGPSGYARYSSPPPNQQQKSQQSLGNFSTNDPYGQTIHGQMGGHSPSQQQHQSSQNSSGFGNFGNFGFSSGQGGSGGGPNILNDHTAQMGVHFGRQMAAAGGEYMEKNVSGSKISISFTEGSDESCS